MRYGLLLMLGLLSGCQCCGLTERYQDRVDAFADREGAWERVYSPAFDLTRIGRSDWCSYPVNHWWCPCRCEKQCPPPCPHVWYPQAMPVVSRSADLAVETTPPAPTEPKYGPQPVVDPPIQPEVVPPAAKPADKLPALELPPAAPVPPADTVPPAAEATSATEVPQSIVPAVVQESLVPNAPEPATSVQQTAGNLEAATAEPDPYAWANSASTKTSTTTEVGAEFSNVYRNRQGRIVAPRPAPQNGRSPRRL